MWIEWRIDELRRMRSGGGVHQIAPGMPRKRAEATVAGAAEFFNRLLKKGRPSMGMFYFGWTYFSRYSSNDE